MDEQDIPKAINSFIDTKIKPHYTKLIESTSDPDARRGLLLHSEEALRGYRTKGLNYESGVRIIRSQSHANSIASNGATSLRLDGSDDNYRKQESLLLQAIDSSPMDVGHKIKALNKGLSELAQGQVDHVAFNNPAKFKPLFKIESKPGTPLTGKETIEELVDNAPVEVVSPHGNIAVASGDPCYGWKHLSEAQKHSVVQRLSSSHTAGKQEERSRVGTLLKDDTSFLRRGIVPESAKDPALSEDYLRQLWGDTTGRRMSAELQTGIDLAPIINQLFLMPPEQAEVELAKLKPDPKNLIGAEFKNKLYADMVKSVHQNNKERKEHPIKWAIDNGLSQEFPDDSAQWGAFFVHRRGVSQTMEKLYGVKSPLLTKEEGRKLTAFLDGKESADVVSHLGAYAEHIGGLNNPPWIETMESLEHPVIGKTGLLLDHNPDDAGYMIRGYKYLTRNRGRSIRDEAGERFDAWFKERFRQKYGEVFASLGDYGDARFDDVCQQAMYHLAGQLLATKGYNFNDAPEKTVFEWLLRQPASAYDKNLEHSFKAIVGNTPVPMGDLGSSLIPPRGMSPEDFTNTFVTAVQRAFKEAGVSDRGHGYENAGSTPDGTAHYRVTLGREYVRNLKTGKRLKIEVAPDKSEAEQAIDRMFKNTTTIMEEHKTNTVKRLLKSQQEDNK
ncbi:hypothetical protein AYO25_03790 [Candidatus Liberibacter solanacearum]|uniref:Uncharacterized protein n=2 Tax=Candidatus Liberibacter solanacearum TaxID=556287 RepID=A0A1V2N7R5_9HYPH|nr:hypothetical protein AYO25_03790 [Candidatus Liberibacter solanacearum]